MKKLIIIFLVLYISAVLVFILGRFHFSKNYLIGKTMSVNTINNIDTRFWKYSGGQIDNFHADLLDFKLDDNKIKNDTFYYENKPVALASKLVYRGFIDYQLTLTSFDKTQSVQYIGK